MKAIQIIVYFILFSFALRCEEKHIDSLKTYRLGEIILESSKNKNTVITSSVNELQYYQINKKDATSMSDLGKYLPSGLIQTNSRGETMLFLRGSGERQLGLFFDGVLLNVPWDNRLDLSILPVDIIGKVFVNKGSSSILYGPNILGGALNISTIERQSDGFGAVLRLQVNDANSQLVSLMHDGKIENFNYIANFSYTKSDGFLLPSNEKVGDSSNQIQNSALRTNTDMESLTAYIRGEYKVNGITFGLSLYHNNSEKGVATLTEAAQSDIRYWRYPAISRDILTLNGEYIISDRLKAKAVFWFDKFNQTIDSYSNILLSELTQKQKDDDLTLGTRISLNYQLVENQNIIIAFNGFQSDHNEIIENSIGNVDSDNDFSQTTISSGIEYNGRYSDLLVSTGLAYDFNKNPKTGIFVDNEGLSNSDYAAFAGLRYFLNNNIDFYANTSRRTRFPTMRESFSGALNKFKVNPNLKPETGLINEVGFQYHKDDFAFELTGFASFYDNLIDQIRLNAEQDSLKRRMRVNFASATISGVEIQCKYNPANSFFADGYFTLMFSEGKNDNGKLQHLEYKPDYMGLVNIGYKFETGLTPNFELEFVGTQWGMNPEGELKELDNYFLLNFRLSYNFFIQNIYFEFFIRTNNLLDQFSVSKIGLPNPGRIFYSGLVVRI